MKMLKRMFPLWTVVVAVLGAGWMSGRFAEFHQVFDVKVTGKGRPVILVPGLATSGAMWDDTVAALRDRYEFHVLTLAGFGGPKAVGEPFLPRVAKGLVEYVDERRLKAPIVVGHSLGAFVAFAAASDCPGAFAGVMAVDGVPFLPALMNPAATPAAMEAQASSVRSMYAGMLPEQYRQQTDFALASMITSPANRLRASEWTRAATPTAVGTAFAELLTTDGRPAAARLTAPVLLIGALGAMPPALRDSAREAYRAQVSGIRNATVVFAEDARHFVTLDDPAFFQRTLEAFLARVPAGETVPCEASKGASQ
ncbi:MAG: alpha/beta hydrolase [Vicinamibacteraceae bacterium]